MVIDAAEFSAGAEQLVAEWRRVLPGEAAWLWVPARQPFAAAMGGGYLALQRDVISQPVAQPPVQHPTGLRGNPTAAAQGLSARQQPEDPAAKRNDSVAAAAGLEDDGMELGSSEAELDPADARQALSLGSSSSGSGGGGGGGPGSHAIVAAAAPLARLALTCHVAYHLSYRVPVLFFEAAGLDGAPLGLDTLLAALPRLREAVCGGQPGTVVTQEEHPFLHRPFLMLHPCQTGAIMQLLTDGRANREATALPAACAAPAAGLSTTKAAVAAAAAGGLEEIQAADSEGHGCGALPAAPAGKALAATGRGSRCALRYLLAWLSVAGQPLGLGVPAELWVQCSQEEARFPDTTLPNVPTRC